MSTTNSSTCVNPREHRGVQIAERLTLQRRGEGWVVPSQSGKGSYVVRLDGDAPRCTCPDNEMRRIKCKHIHAVEISLRREERPDGTTVVTATKRITYKQDWPAYNAAQTGEVEQFAADLLRGLCAGIVQPPQSRGRPRLPLADVVFSAVYKVYGGASGRRTIGTLKGCQAAGYLARVPHYNSTHNCLENPALTPILKTLIEESASPLRAIETDFAVDASGFGTSRFVRSTTTCRGDGRERVKLKCHLMVGVKTNVVTSDRGHGRHRPRLPYLPQLVETTAARFRVGGGCGRQGLHRQRQPCRHRGRGRDPVHSLQEQHDGEGPDLWRRLFHFYMFRRDRFLTHYHKRSNAETAFSMIKGKFGDSVRAKTPTAQVNEVLAKVLCHNVCVLIQSICELGIEPTFWAETAPAQEGGLSA